MNDDGQRGAGGFLVVGVLLILIGEITVAAARSNGSGLTHNERHAQAFGVIIASIGILVALVGVIALGVTIAMTGLGLGQPTLAPDRGFAAEIRPSQSDPADLGDDPAPFALHAEDSAVVADVRRACSFGARPIAIRRIVNQAARAGQLSDGDRLMVEALLVESARRPLGPMRPV